MHPDILLYCGCSERTWNRYPVTPGGYACISPVSGKTAGTRSENYVSVPDGTDVLQDSGAFSDHAAGRLTFGAALDRQIAHAEKHRYASLIKFRGTYDVLIDEVWINGDRLKRRWSVAAAAAAVDETVNAARWLDRHRDGLSLVISAQGVDAAQYLKCVESLMPYYRPGDMFGLGGWCITGKMSAVMLPVFRETVAAVIPFLAGESVDRVHIWGVIYPKALAVLYEACQRYGIRLSTDSAGPSLNPIWSEWGFGSWRMRDYARPPISEMGLARIMHVAETRAWLDRFSTSQDYRSHITAQQRAAGMCDNAPDRESVTRPCAVCGAEIAHRRGDAKTCGFKCRKVLSRRIK